MSTPENNIFNKHIEMRCQSQPATFLSSSTNESSAFAVKACIFALCLHCEPAMKDFVISSARFGVYYFKTQLDAQVNLGIMDINI